MNLCKYKNIFGEINTGVHSVRIFNIAIIDVLATIIVGILLQFFLLRIFSLYIDLTIILVVLFVAGIILHRLFCVRTTIDKLLFNE
jgi:hypothetical protein